MYKKYLAILICIIGLQTTKAQLYESFVHKGEFGGSIGLGKYYGDLDGDSKISRPKFAAGLFYLKQFNNYIGLKVNGSYAFLGSSDVHSPNIWERTRNLSFNSNVWEISVSGQFNFFKFYPGFPEYRYTPYISLGVGVFSYDPYTYFGGDKYFLRSIGTEGQYDTAYTNRPKPYGGTALSIPFTVGFKYALNERMNIFAEACYRFTNTDYLDDVSNTYSPTSFPADPVTGQPSIGYLLQDRSYELGVPNIGTKGVQRGNSKQKDSYLTFQIGISFNLQSYRCPTGY